MAIIDPKPPQVTTCGQCNTDCAKWQPDLRKWVCECGETSILAGPVTKPAFRDIAPVGDFTRPSATDLITVLRAIVEDCEYMEFNRRRFMDWYTLPAANVDKARDLLAKFDA